jgi:hypothetical protein
MSISAVTSYSQTLPAVLPAPPRSAESKNSTDSNRAKDHAESHHAHKKPVTDTVTISKQAMQLAAQAHNA